MVVLTDGADTESKMKLEELMPRIRFDGEAHTIRVFTIAYGGDARKDILKQIADATQAKSYEGTPQNIVGVFRDISTSLARSTRSRNKWPMGRDSRG